MADSANDARVYFTCPYCDCAASIQLRDLCVEIQDGRTQFGAFHTDCSKYVELES